MRMVLKLLIAPIIAAVALSILMILIFGEWVAQ